MANRTLLLLLGLLLAGHARAQTWLGLRGGATLSRVGFDPVRRNLGLLPGAQFGLAFIHIPTGRTAGVQIEINFVQKGWQESLDSVTRYARVVNYLEVPFLSHIVIGKRRFRTLLHFGPFVGINLSSAERVSSPAVFSRRDALRVVPDNRLDLGITAGLGFSYNLGRSTLQLEARVSPSLTSLYSTRTNPSIVASQNQVASAALIYLFRISKLPKPSPVATPRGSNSPP